MAGGILRVSYEDFEGLLSAMEAYEGNTENAINEVLHTYAGERLQEEIYRLMPVSNKRKGKHARDSKSLSNINGNLSVTVTARGKWHYLYFPDDGSNTRNHAGNQQFFKRGGEAAQNDIVERCIERLTSNF